MMQESSLQTMTLLSWTLQIWRDHRRGMPLVGQSATIAYCMQHHREWWSDWDSVSPTTADQDRYIGTRLLHIHNDATILLQVSSQQPKEIYDLYQTLTEKGFNEFESIHTIALAMTEEATRAKERSEPFDSFRYVDGAKGYVAQALTRQNLTRTAKAKAY